MTLNERVAKVKGWHYNVRYDLAAEAADKGESRDWSHRIADAWELVEELLAQGLDVAVESTRYRDGLCFTASVSDKDAYDAATAPKAICLAWLAVMEGES